MLKVKLNYPTKDEELAILNRMAAVDPKLNVEPVLTAADIFKVRDAIDQIHVDDKVKRYIVDVVHATRNPAEHGLDIAPYVQYGASPRATIFLTRGARAQAFLEGRGYVTPQDVKTIGYDVLRHRVSVTYEAEAEDLSSDHLIKRIFDHLKVP
jgi:MoxR-like ATPase